MIRVYAAGIDGLPGASSYSGGTRLIRLLEDDDADGRHEPGVDWPQCAHWDLRKKNCAGASGSREICQEEFVSCGRLLAALAWDRLSRFVCEQSFTPTEVLGHEY